MNSGGGGPSGENDPMTAKPRALSIANPRRRDALGTFGAPSGWAGAGIRGILGWPIAFPQEWAEPAGARPESRNAPDIAGIDGAVGGSSGAGARAHPLMW